MILTSELGTFKKVGFTGKITDCDGNLLVNGTDYNAVSPAPVNGVLFSNNIAEFTSIPNSLGVGDSVKITGQSGVPRNNYIKGIGANRIEFGEHIPENSGTDITIISEATLVTLLATMKEGIYYFSDAETLFVNSVFLAIKIPFAEMKANYHGLAADYDIELHSRTAVDSILADFSFDASFINVVGIGQLKGLMILKMVQKIEAGKGDSPVTKADTEYYKALGRIRNKIKVAKDKSLTNTEVLDPNNDNDNSIDFSLGVWYAWSNRC